MAWKTVISVFKYVLASDASCGWSCRYLVASGMACRYLEFLAGEMERARASYVECFLESPRDLIVSIA